MSKISTAECIEFTDWWIEYFAKQQRPDNIEFARTIRAKLLAADEMAKALEFYAREENYIRGAHSADKISDDRGNFAQFALAIYSGQRRGTFNCPICNKDYPHHHPEKALADYRAAGKP